MKIGKIVTLAVIGVLVFEFRGASRDHVEVAKHAGTIVRSYIEMYSVRSGLDAYLAENRRPPRNLSGWLDQHYQPRGARPPSQDLFGNRYRLTRGEGKGWQLRSCGPDGRCNNEDDLVLSVAVGG